MSIYISDNCRFVKGFKNAAFYDFNNNKVFAINNIGRKIIEDALNGNKISFDDEKYIEKLLNLNLLSTVKSLSDKDEIPKNDLKFAWLEITEKCNLKCVHCYGEFGLPKIECEHLLSIEEWKNLIKELVKNGCTSIQFIGGEPTLSPYLYELLEFSKNNGMDKISIFTNATIFKEKDIEALKKYNVSVRVSLYGHTSKIHDNITGKIGSFESNKKNLILLKKYKVPTTISVIIMKENEKYLQEIKDYIKSINYEFLGYDVIRATEFENRYTHSITDYNVLKQRYLCEPEFYTSRSDYMRYKHMNPCWNGKIAITSTGDVLPCVFARNEIIGNIKTTSVKNIVSKQNKYSSITKDKIEVCRDCEFRYACHDCRPLAKGVYNSIYAKNPRCLYDPYEGKWGKIEDVSLEIYKDNL